MIEMYKILHEKQIGDFQISHFEINELFVAAFLLKDALDCRSEYTNLKSGTYVKLCRKGAITMSDMLMEYHTNSEFIQKAHGDVLVKGLGIWLIIIAIKDNPEVKSITIVEKHQEIIDLVFPYLPIKKDCEIVCEDIFSFTLEKNLIRFILTFGITLIIMRKKLRFLERNLLII